MLGRVTASARSAQMPPWDVEATRQAVRRLYGKSQLDLAVPCLRSLADRQFYARFHFGRARASLARYIKTLDPEDPMPTLFGQDEEGWQRFNVVIRKLAADVTACVQSIHALPDILASAVYYSLALDRTHTPRDGGYVNHAFVVNALASLKAQAVRASLSQMTLSSSYKHLAALSNQSKHYSIVFPALNTDLTGEREQQHMLVIPAFKSKSETYPQVFVSEFLPPVYEQTNTAVLATGHALLAHLRSAG